MYGVYLQQLMKLMVKLKSLIAALDLPNYKE